MLYKEYKKKHPLTKFGYTRQDVEVIREHAFNAAKESVKKRKVK